MRKRSRENRTRNLVGRLDGPADWDAVSAWEAEILRRLDEIDSGAATLIDREAFRRRMKARLGRT